MIEDNKRKSYIPSPVKVENLIGPGWVSLDFLFYKYEFLIDRYSKGYARKATRHLENRVAFTGKTPVIVYEPEFKILFNIRDKRSDYHLLL